MRTTISRLGLACALGLLALPVAGVRAEDVIHSAGAPAPADQKLVARFTALPYKDSPSADELVAHPNVPTIPLWTGSIKAGASVGGQTFSFRMVGPGNPRVHLSVQTSSVKTSLIPVSFKFASFGNKIFNPAVNDPTCAHGIPVQLSASSPIFHPATFPGAGKGEYLDVFQRANFFQFTKAGSTNPGYHIKLVGLTAPTVQVLPVLNVTVTGGSLFDVPCGPGRLGALDINAFDPFIQGQIKILKNKGIGPGNFPIFLFTNVVLYDGTPSNCCILGYHSAFNNAGAVQTYGIADYDSSLAFTGSSDISALSHEVAEWLDDPLVNNATPIWGHIGQVGGCQANLEVGDPLSGTTRTVSLGGHVYHVQDEATVPWFFRVPSFSIGGKFSLFGTLTTNAGPLCH
jgi:hypothetical protein